MPPSFALICFLSCCFNDNTALYISPGIDVFEGIGMAAFFLLLSDYVVRDGDLDNFFTNAKDSTPPQGSDVWYQVRKLAELFLSSRNAKRFIEIGIRRYTMGDCQCPAVDCHCC